MSTVREPMIKPIPILSLRPTQMTVGMREVKEKRKRWREQKKKKQAESLGKHMIPVVRGPDQRYYVVDHHHLDGYCVADAFEHVLRYLRHAACRHEHDIGRELLNHRLVHGGVETDIDAVLLLKLLHEPFGQKIVEVVAAQPVVAVACEHLGYVAFDADH